LTGAPAVRRQKTYSAQSGYVYQYYYEGHREAEQATEYVFDVTADRKTSFPVSVLVEHGGVAAWNLQHGRELSGTEIYAVAKMSLFQAFDDRPRPDLMHEPVRVRAEAIAEIVSTLDLD
jgi:hypothetical protein